MKAGVKNYTHLAILLLTALNASGGWHDSAPFVAWPATNHLRWADNVGVYTNASNPTNPAYGAWTNNFVFADWYAGNTLTFGGDVLFPYVLQSTNYSWTTNVILNAKETRAMDCFAALRERYLATGGNATNFWEVALPYTVVEGNFSYYLLWRDERLALRAMKDVLRTYEADGYTGQGLLANYYYPSPTNGTPTNWVAYTEATLAAAAGVPPNFFDYTPHRAADGSWTHYQRILTNTFVLRQGTNAAHVATNSLVDSAGIEFTAVGTNGLTITRYATNINQQAGVTLGAYGWDGLRRVISNLNTTVSTVSWGIGTGTNWDTGYLSNFPALTIGNFSQGTVGDELDTSAFQTALTSTYALPYALRDDTWSWAFSSVFSSGVTLLKTNVAPYARADAMWYGGVSIVYYWYLNNGLSRVGGGPWCIDGTLMVYVNDFNSYFSHTRSNSVHWNNYGAPLVVSVNTNIPFSGTAMYYVKTNGVSYMFASNTISGELSTRTSAVYRINHPTLSGDFGVQFNPTPAVSDFQHDIYTYPDSPNTAEYRLRYLAYSSTKNTLSGITAWGMQTSSTNFPLPTVTADKAVIQWDFDYK